MRLPHIIVLAALCMGATSDTYVGGTLTYNEPRWEDLRFSGIELGVPPGLAPFATPDLIVFPVGGSTNTYTYCLDSAQDEGLIWAVQMPHARKDNSNIEPHLHWAPSTTDTGTVVFVIECTGLTDEEETFGGTLTTTLTDSGDGVANKHQNIDNGAFSGANSSVSAMIVCSIWRDVSEDDGTFDACIMEVDFHILIDTPGGSTGEHTK